MDSFCEFENEQIIIFVDKEIFINHFWYFKHFVDFEKADFEEVGEDKEFEIFGKGFNKGEYFSDEAVHHNQSY